MDKDTLMKINGVLLSKKEEPGSELEIFWLKVVENHKNEYVVTSRAHYHNFFEVHFILNGSIFYKINDEKVTVNKNHYIVITPQKKHTVLEYSDDFMKLSIAFSINDEEICKRLKVCEGTKSKITNNLKSEIHFIAAQAERKNFYTAQLIRNRIFEILCLITGTDEITEGRKNTSIDTDERLKMAKKIIEQNEKVFLKASEVARACHLSTKQLGRIFEKYEKKTLLQYIHDVKIAQAQRLLSTNDDSLKRISEMLGFSSEYYFNSFFKKKTGMTPGDYRKAQPDR